MCEISALKESDSIYFLRSIKGNIDDNEPDYQEPKDDEYLKEKTKEFKLNNPHIDIYHVRYTHPGSSNYSNSVEILYKYMPWYISAIESGLYAKLISDDNDYMVSIPGTVRSLLVNCKTKEVKWVNNSIIYTFLLKERYDELYKKVF
ncbi:hypothetical protein LCGC14_1974310 [marine sediment metagenome]|uniref:Uncharacterized protein n=1 Tax=marine sediment metagenome TaxID=412755 RepID=A0A0F9FAT3_9ZZZZ